MVLIRKAEVASPGQQQIGVAAQFYGLSLRVFAADGSGAASAYQAARVSTTLAVIVEADALSSLDQSALFGAMRRGNAGSIPLLIADIGPETDKQQLMRWSSGAVSGTGVLDGSPALHDSIGNVAGVTRQLSGAQVPLAGHRAIYLERSVETKSDVVMKVEDGHRSEAAFIKVDAGREQIFMLCSPVEKGNSEAERAPIDAEDAFAPIAAAMMFSRLSAGERGWHALQHDANLTIDDPWLHEPYGGVSYAGLLKEMEEHNFHTTIAFIPWNYDRSEAQVVSLFKGHPERYSISIHGDDHSHKEFTDYASKPLGAQVAALGQSLARMEQFKRNTGIAYDRVMVFPHSIAPEKTLEALKTDNYWATINSDNVPMDAARPAGLLYALRPATLTFGGFPSVFRYPATVAPSTYGIAVNAFLGNPLLYYTHQEFFAPSIKAFDATADAVNRQEPDTRWSSLGEIVKHLYLVRLRDDGNYDVLASSGNIELENPFGRDVVFHISRPETDPQAIASVSLDGKRIAFEMRDGSLEASVAVPAGATRTFAIEYRNDLNLAAVSIEKNSMRANLLRRVSDFRDITLSESVAGRAITEYYYAHGESAKPLVLAGCGVLLLCGCAGWGLIAMVKRRKNAHRVALSAAGARGRQRESVL